MVKLQDWIDEFQGDPDYEFTKVAIDIGEQIVARMEERGMTQADLARAMGVSRARVSQILRGNDNLTLKSIVAVAIALDCRVEMLLKPLPTTEPGQEAQLSPTETRPLAPAT